MAEAETKPQPLRKLLETHDQFADAENVRREKVVRPELGTTLAEMMVPAYWDNVAKRLSPGDKVEIWSRDGKWMAELRVIAVEPHAVRMQEAWTMLIRSNKAAASKAEAPDGYKITNRGVRGFVVERIDGTDVVALQDKLKTHDDALAWLSAHLAKLAA